MQKIFKISENLLNTFPNIGNGGGGGRKAKFTNEGWFNMGVTFWFSVIIKIYQYIMHMIVWNLKKNNKGEYGDISQNFS